MSGLLAHASDLLAHASGDFALLFLTESTEDTELPTPTGGNARTVFIPQWRKETQRGTSLASLIKLMPTGGNARTVFLSSLPFELFEATLLVILGCGLLEWICKKSFVNTGRIKNLGDSVWVLIFANAYWLSPRNILAL